MAFFPSLKHNFIAYRSSKVSSRPDCIFEIHQLRKSGFSWVYSCCSCSFEPEILKIVQSSHKMYSNNVLNFLPHYLPELPTKIDSYLSWWILHKLKCNQLLPHLNAERRFPLMSVAFSTPLKCVLVLAIHAFAFYGTELWLYLLLESGI